MLARWMVHTYKGRRCTNKEALLTGVVDKAATRDTRFPLGYKKILETPPLFTNSRLFLLHFWFCPLYSKVSEYTSLAVPPCMWWSSQPCVLWDRAVVLFPVWRRAVHPPYFDLETQQRVREGGEDRKAPWKPASLQVCWSSHLMVIQWAHGI